MMLNGGCGGRVCAAGRPRMHPISIATLRAPPGSSFPRSCRPPTRAGFLLAYDLIGFSHAYARQVTCTKHSTN
jgi:hypothetical protein